MRSFVMLAMVLMFSTEAFAQVDLEELKKDGTKAARIKEWTDNFCTKEKMPFSKRTSIFAVPGKQVKLKGKRAPIMFEVNLAVPIPIMYLCPTRWRSDRHSHRIQAVIEFDSVIRMTKHSSSPVATPSYNPYFYAAYELRIPASKTATWFSDYNFNLRITPLATTPTARTGSSSTTPPAPRPSTRYRR